MKNAHLETRLIPTLDPAMLCVFAYESALASYLAFDADNFVAIDVTTPAVCNSNWTNGSCLPPRPRFSIQATH